MKVFIVRRCETARLGECLGAFSEKTMAFVRAYVFKKFIYPQEVTVQEIVIDDLHGLSDTLCLDTTDLLCRQEEYAA